MTAAERVAKHRAARKGKPVSKIEAIAVAKGEAKPARVTTFLPNRFMGRIRPEPGSRLKGKT